MVSGPVQLKPTGNTLPKREPKPIPEDGYVVAKKNDNLWDLSRTYGVKFEDIKKWNAELGADFKLMPGKTRVQLKDPSPVSTAIEGAVDSVAKAVGWNSEGKVKTTPAMVMKRVDEKIGEAKEAFKNKDLEGAETALHSALAASRRKGSNVPNLFKTEEAFNAHVLKQAPELKGLINGSAQKKVAVEAQTKVVNDADAKLDIAQQRLSAARENVQALPEAVTAAEKHVTTATAALEKAQQKAERATSEVDQVVNVAAKQAELPPVQDQPYDKSLHSATDLLATRKFPEAKAALEKAWEKASPLRKGDNGAIRFGDRQAFNAFVTRNFPALAPLVPGADGKAPIEKLTAAEKAANAARETARGAHEKATELLSTAKDKLKSEQHTVKVLLNEAQNEALEAKKKFDAELKKLKDLQKK